MCFSFETNCKYYKYNEEGKLIIIIKENFFELNTYILSIS